MTSIIGKLVTVTANIDKVKHAANVNDDFFIFNLASLLKKFKFIIDLLQNQK